MNWTDAYKNKKLSLEEAAGWINSGDQVFLGPITSFPLELVNAITARKDIKNVRFLSGLIMAFPDFLMDETEDRFTYVSSFMGPVERMFVDRGNIEPLSIHFSQAAAGMNSINMNAAILEVSPPDAHGFMCIGPGSSFMGKSTFVKADKVIVQINPKVPYFHGTDMHIHMNEVDGICNVDRPLPELPDSDTDPVQTKIAELIADRIKNGSTIQLGFGKLANAIGDKLLDKKDLGIHTDFLTPSMIELCRQGAVSGRKKNMHQEKIIASFCVGKTAEYEFLHNNVAVEFHPASYVNNPENIRKNDNFVSVNNALAVDLTGQVSSESMGYRQYSATGGQVDFVRGAKLSKGGMAVLALKSTATVNGETISRIPSAFAPGTIVTTPRSDVQFVATEYGIAELEYKTIPERVNQMISIAHPDFREGLAKEAVDGGLVKAGMLRACS